MNVIEKVREVQSKTIAVNKIKKTKIISMANNQFVFIDSNFRIFQSYESLIAAYDYHEGILYLNNNMWAYSKTTLKYFKQFIEDYTFFDYGTKSKFTKNIEKNEKIKIIA